MFERHKSTPATPAPAAPAKKEAAVADYVIHSLPKEFYDRAAKLPEPQVAAAGLATKPQAQLPPTTQLTPRPPVTAPASRTLLPMNRGPRGPISVKPKVVVPPPPKKSYKKVLIAILAIVLILGAGVFVVGYSLGWFSKAVEPVVVPPTQTPPTTPPVVTPPAPAPDKAVLGADTDSDGLTNVEEILYQTDFRNPDSDGDTFLDGNEVFHRYNPIGLAPSTLLDIGAVRVLETVDLPFSMSYPTAWNPINQPAAKNVSFRSTDTGAQVSVKWESKDPALSLGDWYVAGEHELRFEDLHATTTKERYPALIGSDERIMYIDGGSNVYTLEYELGDSKSVEFLQTFKMMANSFKLSP